MFVEVLKEIYDKYERFIYDEALRAGQPPPVKKLRLASSTASPIVSQNSKQVGITELSLTSIIYVGAQVHFEDVRKKGQVVSPPHIYSGQFPGDTDDEGENGGGSGLEGRTFFLTRTQCPKCVEADDEVFFYHCAPEYITWTDSKAAPDGCPICQSVLFKKGSQGSQVRDEDF
jgi:hypothetical protein